jgi:hypothetical protein
VLVDSAARPFAFEIGTPVVMHGQAGLSSSDRCITMKTFIACLALAATAAAQGSTSNYCQATPNSFGTVATISSFGSLSLSANQFTLTVAGTPAHPTSFGMFTYGSHPYDVPFGNGYLCVMPFSPGIHKMTPQPLTGQMLTCSMAQQPGDFTQFTPASTWYFQFWYRDPAAGGAKFNLSDGLQVTFN